MTAPAASTRVGLIGLGDIGITQHLPALLRSHRVVIDSVADRSPERRSQASDLLSGTATQILTEADEVLDRALDAVILATPPWVTPTLALSALSRGMFVLAEKPVAIDHEQVRLLTAMPGPWRDRYQLGLTYRHDHAIERLRRAVHDGALGDGPLLVHASIYDEVLNHSDPEHYARIMSALAHGNPSVHEGAHVFDWLTVILGGEPLAVDDAWAVTTVPDAPAPNIVGARLRFPEGTVANVEFGWLLPTLPPGFIRVTGSHGTAELDLAEFDLSITSATTTEQIRDSVPKMQRCFDRQLASFLDLTQGLVARPSVGLNDGLSTLRIADRIDALLHGPKNEADGSRSR